VASPPGFEPGFQP